MTKEKYSIALVEGDFVKKTTYEVWAINEKINLGLLDFKRTTVNTSIAGHSIMDAKRLETSRPNPKEVNGILVHYKGKPLLIDGNHRIRKMQTQGHTHAIVAELTEEQIRPYIKTRTFRR